MPLRTKPIEQRRYEELTKLLKEVSEQLKRIADAVEAGNRKEHPKAA